MPLMDGLMLTRAVRAQNLFGKLPVLLLMSSASREPNGIAEELGICATILKPLRRDSLLAAIRRALNAGAERTPQTRSASVPVRSAPPTRGHILLTEDNQVNQKVCGLILTKLGYTYEIAGNGREALDTLERGNFAAILLDCQMPEIDGFEAARAIRTREALGHDTVRFHIPIIALTAGATAGERERCLAAGMDDYVSKPVRVEVLAARLEAWVPVSPAEIG